MLQRMGCKATKAALSIFLSQLGPIDGAQGDDSHQISRVVNSLLQPRINHVNVTLNYPTRPTP
jgi:hypothetical protein